MGEYFAEMVAQKIFSQTLFRLFIGVLPAICLFSVLVIPRESSAQTIAVIVHKSPEKKWADFLRGAREASRSLKVGLNVIGADKTPASMASAIDKARQQKVSGVILPLTFPAKGGADIKRLTSRKIPVISVGPNAQESAELGLFAHVGADPFFEGQFVAAGLAARKVKKILCITPEEGHAKNYCAGAKRHGKSTVTVFLPDNVPVDKILKNSASGFIVTDPLLWPRVREFLITKAEGKPVVVIGESPPVMQALQRGELAFVSSDQPYLQGVLSVSNFALYLRFGLQPDKLIRTGGKFVLAPLAP